MKQRNPARGLSPVNLCRAACSVSEKQSRLRAYQRNAICLFGGAVDGESCRVIVFPSLAPIAFRVQPKNGKGNFKMSEQQGKAGQFGGDQESALLGGALVEAARGNPLMRTLVKALLHEHVTGEDDRAFLKARGWP